MDGRLSASDRQTLADLNQAYIQSARSSDVARFGELLADDFLCSLPDGTLLDRRQFLERAARPLDIRDLEAHDVNVRLLGEVAIVHARTTYTCDDGRRGSGRYTDVWARRDGRWVAVAAQFSRT
jgi:ketosteroid isomerase-like protein